VGGAEPGDVDDARQYLPPAAGGFGARSRRSAGQWQAQWGIFYMSGTAKRSMTVMEVQMMTWTGYDTCSIFFMAMHGMPWHSPAVLQQYIEL